MILGFEFIEPESYSDDEEEMKWNISGKFEIREWVSLRFDAEGLCGIISSRIGVLRFHLLFLVSPFLNLKDCRSWERSELYLMKALRLSA